MTAVLIGQIACAILGYFFVAGLWFSLVLLDETFRVRRFAALTWPVWLAMLAVGYPLATVWRAGAGVVRMVRG